MIAKDSVGKFVSYWSARSGSERSRCHQLWDSLLGELLEPVEDELYKNVRYERLVRNHVDLRKASALVKKTEAQPKDIVRSPAILEFAGVAPGEYLESDLDRGLIKHLGKFMMELGRRFCLECEQRPIQIGGKTYHLSESALSSSANAWRSRRRCC